MTEETINNKAEGKYQSLNMGDLVKFPDGVVTLVTSFSSSENPLFEGVCVQEGDGRDKVGEYAGDWTKNVQYRKYYNGNIEVPYEYEIVVRRK
jgi:hypothetical protein